MLLCPFYRCRSCQWMPRKVFFLCDRFIEIYFTHFVAHPFKSTIQWFLVYSRSGAISTTINFRTFSSPQKEIPSPLAVTPHSLFSQLLETTSLLSVYIELPILEMSCKWDQNHMWSFQVGSWTQVFLTAVMFTICSITRCFERQT